MSADLRPDRHALLELDALLSEIRSLRAEGDATRFAADPRYRWVLHRLWIAAGNEALAYTTATGQSVRSGRLWANLYDLRNHLAHSRLPDVDEGLVQRFTWTRTDSLHANVQESSHPLQRRHMTECQCLNRFQAYRHTERQSNPRLLAISKGTPCDHPAATLALSAGWPDESSAR